MAAKLIRMIDEHNRTHYVDDNNEMYGKDIQPGDKLLATRGFSASVIVVRDDVCVGWIDTLNIPDGPYKNAREYMKVRDNKEGK